MNLYNSISKYIGRQFFTKKPTTMESNPINNTANNIANLVTTNPDTIPYFSFEGQTFLAVPCNIYDGDTFSIIFEYRGEVIKYRCRCLGYDSPEMKPLKTAPNREKEMEAAKAAKSRFTELLQSTPMKMIRVKCGAFDKYGRILVTVWNGGGEDSVNDIMIREGHGRPYTGGTKEEV